jgi:plasmid replication initiation protein
MRGPAGTIEASRRSCSTVSAVTSSPSSSLESRFSERCSTIEPAGARTERRYLEAAFLTERQRQQKMISSRKTTLPTNWRRKVRVFHPMAITRPNHLKSLFIVL